MADDPERERRLAAFQRGAEPSETMSVELEAFVAGCDYEAGVLEGLLEHMGRQKHEEFKLLQRVADLQERWTGSMENIAEATFVFEKVKVYVKLRQEAMALEAKGDED